jgi:hypothetical protein
MPALERRRGAHARRGAAQAAHLLVAAADFVLVPSRFEPCGLVAQAAVRYGAVPIVAPVGGLADLVVPGVRPTAAQRRPSACSARGPSQPACGQALLSGRSATNLLSFASTLRVRQDV